MYHSITIGTKNTWDDWHLIPATRPLVNPPTVKTNMVDVPGGDGALDLTTSLTGRPTFANRTGSWTFYVENGFREWADLYSEIMVYLHGKELLAVLEDDPGYYYKGRFSVNSWKSDSQWSQITIDYNVEPYKRNVRTTGEDWLWDPFNFETGVIRNYENLSVVDTLNVTIDGDMVESIPVILCSASGMTVTFKGHTYNLSKGANTIDDIILVSGENELTFNGNGMISIKYAGGRL